MFALLILQVSDAGANTYTVKKTAASSLIIAFGVFDVCRILQLFFDVFLTV